MARGSTPKSTNWSTQNGTREYTKKIGVTITQGNLCPRFCRYKSDFRTQNYKSGVSQEKNLQKNVPVRKIFLCFFVFEIALNFYNQRKFRGRNFRVTDF